MNCANTRQLADHGGRRRWLRRVRAWLRFWSRLTGDRATRQTRTRALTASSSPTSKPPVQRKNRYGPKLVRARNSPIKAGRQHRTRRSQALTHTHTHAQQAASRRLDFAARRLRLSAGGRHSTTGAPRFFSAPGFNCASALAGRFSSQLL